jgi:hypothetical protein
LIPYFPIPQVFLKKFFNFTREGEKKTFLVAGGGSSGETSKYSEAPLAPSVPNLPLTGCHV